MPVMTLAGGAILLALSAWIACVNIAGCTVAVLRPKRGGTGGYSCIPIISLVLGLLAWLLLRKPLGLWAFLPAGLDPGTWMTFACPFIVGPQIWRARR